MDKYKRLVSNTMLFAISTFSSKLLSFVMAPLFSYWFETQEMNGIKELLNQCASLLIPLVSLGIANAVIRFGLEKGIRKSAIYMNGLVSIGMGFVLLLLLYPLLSRIALFRDYIALLYVYLLVSCLRTLNCQFCRARQLNRLYANNRQHKYHVRLLHRHIQRQYKKMERAHPAHLRPGRRQRQCGSNLRQRYAVRYVCSDKDLAFSGFQAI